MFGYVVSSFDSCSFFPASLLFRQMCSPEISPVNPVCLIDSLLSICSEMQNQTLMENILS
ncbi:mCG147813 [Mus musculus]|nr:mCG147813 [Mus musculus]